MMNPRISPEETTNTHLRGISLIDASLGNQRQYEETRDGPTLRSS